MDILFLIGRILFGGFFIMMGMNHFMKMDMMINYATSKKVPATKLMVALTGLFLIVGGLGMLLGIYINLSVLLLTVFLVLTSFKMHTFWKMEKGEARMTEMRYFMSNMALTGAVLMTLAISNWPMSL